MTSFRQQRQPRGPQTKRQEYYTQFKVCYHYTILLPLATRTGIEPMPLVCDTEVTAQTALSFLQGKWDSNPRLRPLRASILSAKLLSFLQLLMRSRHSHTNVYSRGRRLHSIFGKLGVEPRKTCLSVAPSLILRVSYAIVSRASMPISFGMTSYFSLFTGSQIPNKILTFILISSNLLECVV